MTTARTANGAAAKKTAGEKPRRKRGANARLARGSLTAADIVTAAFEVANEVSLADFSMPMLAKHLDVGVTSLYWHFRKKEDLLDAMTDEAYSYYHDTTPFDGVDSWQDALRRHFNAIRRILRGRPVLVELILLRSRRDRLNAQSQPATADLVDSVVSAMVEVGFAIDDALEIYLALMAHVCGAAMVDYQEMFSTYSGGAPGRGTGDRVPIPLFTDLAGKGHEITNVEDMAFDFGFEAMISAAERRLTV
ncbi:TetR family transcriptional regulator [Gordonia sp. ABSL1-1]|uniref:TetR family transcriptional regulator n=1 Tax=Gordonia sp. ABSL1-1 TaxID=3053923 RepID=UPI0025733CEA|nr:TetR family transcriptional regulator [Gordonia sp. ABSL1-1]MDL9936577.1 TetR family transcriptional regulator [Gordonia sp. ABSL1-1]